MDFKKNDIKETVKKVTIGCSNCGKETMIDFDLFETDYREIITTFVLNTMLHHIGMIWIIENNEDLKYYMDIKDSDWTTGGPCYNTSICKKLHRKIKLGIYYKRKN